MLTHKMQLVSNKENITSSNIAVKTNCLLKYINMNEINVQNYVPYLNVILHEN